MKNFAALVWLTFLSAATVAALPTYKCVADIAGGINTKEKAPTSFRIDFEWRVLPYQQALPLLKSDEDRNILLQSVIYTLAPSLQVRLEDKNFEERKSLLAAMTTKDIYVVRQTNEAPDNGMNYVACSHGSRTSMNCSVWNQTFYLDRIKLFFSYSTLSTGDHNSAVFHGTCTPFYD